MCCTHPTPPIIFYFHGPKGLLFLLFALQQFLKNPVFVTGNKVPSTHRAEKTSSTTMDFEYTYMIIGAN
uniref:Putative ovule protein n=1 Tax=Solanum chacoense TaxID=4108 RepID=A0A0V0H4K1_SOLCH